MAAFSDNKTIGLEQEPHVDTAASNELGVVYSTTVHDKIKNTKALHTQNRFEEAFKAYKDILAENPKDHGALLGVGRLLKKHGNSTLANDFFSQILKDDPANVSALLERGKVYRSQGLDVRAIIDFSKIISTHRDNSHAFVSRGITFANLKKFHLAKADFDHAITIDPYLAEAFFNRGVLHEKLEKYEKAKDDYLKSIELQPKDYKSHNNLGVIYRELGNFQKSVDHFDHCIKINKNFKEAIFNKSLTLLLSGEFKAGWRLYEQRWFCNQLGLKKTLSTKPLWDGNADLTGKKILIQSEQGLGDTLQFCRYIKKLKQYDCTIFFEVEISLVRIMKSLLPETNILKKGEKLPDHDFHCPLLSLPLAFKTQISNIPAEVPYLQVGHSEKKFWRQKLKTKKRMKLGFAWRGNPNHPKNHRRSVVLSDVINFLPKTVDWISLQFDATGREIELIDNFQWVTHYGDQLGDFAKTASLCELLDTIVSVDTSLVHLTGAIGKPSHLVLDTVPDFRWLAVGSSSPWYPCHQLYRKAPNQKMSDLFIMTCEKVANQYS